MVNYPPDYCPYCGGELDPVEPPTASRCRNCEEFVFYNPVPQARVVVVDDGAVLLAEIPPSAAEDRWTLPGGAIEVGEDPPTGGARELHEEVGLSVDPDDLTYVDARTYEKWDDLHRVGLFYAVHADAVSGTIEPDGDEHTDARFWTPEEFAAAGQALGEFRALPDRYTDLGWWVESATAAVESDR